MKKTIYAGVIALFLTVSAATNNVQAGDGNGHDVGRCTNPCTQSSTPGTNTTGGVNAASVANTLAQIVISLIPKG